MDAFEAIADPTRRALVARLAQRPARVVDLATEHPVSRPAISRHLRVLGEAGVVSAVDHGRERHYELVPGGLAAVRDWLDGLPSGAAPPFGEHHLEALNLEVRRTVRELDDSGNQSSEQKEAG
ncbi:ArsR/SmtB family transcription factor [Gordonia westfalica]|uniref:Regulatory protein, arsR family n=1 Tax=Gordonia westfalica TaxID=158898 RepID=A0A1H2KHK9_9ACTN|nr:metalloregulator ArsR/SmtB family transcription factor [Gordonia westfalica]SDU68134.1 regulatory protein, arsR family [Gordonia westfalica]